jgi:hypothetical protein
MALSQEVVTVTTKSGAIRSYGTADWDSTEAAALLVSATVDTSTDILHQSGASARASIDTGVVTVQVEGPVGAGPVDVVITIDA